MAWYDTLINGANSLGAIYNAAKPLINTGAAIYDRNQTRGAITDAFNQYKGFADNSLSTLGNVYQEGKQATQPYRDAGNTALAGYQNLQQNPGQITNDPGYQFRLNQGNEAVTRNAAANRMMGSGNFATALNDYGQGMATQELDKSLSRYIPLMNAGQNANSQLMDAGRNYSYGVGEINRGLGAAAAGSEVGRAGASSDMLGDILGLGRTGQLANGTGNPLSSLGAVGGGIRDLVTGGASSAATGGSTLASMFGGGGAAAGAGSLPAWYGAGATPAVTSGGAYTTAMGGATPAAGGAGTAGAGLGAMAASFGTVFALPSVLKALTGSGGNRQEFAQLSQQAAANPQQAISSMSAAYLNPSNKIVPVSGLTGMLSLANIGAIQSSMIPQEVFDSPALLKAFETDDLGQLRGELMGDLAGLQPTDTLMQIYDRTTNPQLKARILSLMPVIDDHQSGSTTPGFRRFDRYRGIS